MNWKLQFRLLGENLEFKMDKDIKRNVVSKNKRILQLEIILKKNTNLQFHL